MFPQVASVSSEEINDLTMKLCSAKTKLEVYRGRSREAVDEMKLMDAKYQEASSKLKKQLSQFARHILDLKKQLAEKE
ncbi:hypothetical protein AXF42_Ash018591 [Apostasia shenzhenica]|uniref:Uncharacterized protein n=1 Tax=Apostasia shenzhenica TaxID=1088818 RepID=A0A2I0AQ70_9ASPA|nr:hypothetical protein AXF42_Ash018591 [Apostasia shenzhenica]